MLTKIYMYTWLAITAAFTAVLVSGSLTPLAIVVFGFVAFGMVFAGMMCVLPVEVSHSAIETLPDEKAPSQQPVVAPPVRHGVRTAGLILYVLN
jgi:hypothetical protein